MEVMLIKVQTLKARCRDPFYFRQQRRQKQYCGYRYEAPVHEPGTGSSCRKYNGLYKQHYQRKHNACQYKQQSFLKDGRGRHEHPERRDHKEQQGCAEENIEEEERALGIGLMQFGEFIDRRQQRFNLVRNIAGRRIIKTLRKEQRVAVLRFQLQVSQANRLAYFFEGQVGIQFLCNCFFLFQEIGIAEDENDAAECVDEHDAGQKEAEVAVPDTHAVVYGCFTAHEAGFGEQRKGIADTRANAGGKKTTRSGKRNV